MGSTVSTETTTTTDDLPPSGVATQVPLLQVRDLKVRFTQNGRTVRAVDGVNYSLGGFGAREGF